MKPALRSATLITVRVAVLAGIAAGSYCTWDTQPSQGQGEGFVRGSGRIEATEMDVATRQRGRIQHIFAREGEFVVAGQRVALIQARNDTALLDCEVRAPRDGLVQDWLAEPGEVLETGGAVLRMLDLGHVFMTFLLPEALAGRVALGSEARIVLDGVPEFVIPAKVSSLVSMTSVPPGTPATAQERLKLMFRVKAQIEGDLLRQHLQQVTTGRSGVVWMKVDPHAEWPAVLSVSPELIVRARS